MSVTNDKAPLGVLMLLVKQLDVRVIKRSKSRICGIMKDRHLFDNEQTGMVDLLERFVVCPREGRKS